MGNAILKFVRNESVGKLYSNHRHLISYTICQSGGLLTYLLKFYSGGAVDLWPCFFSPHFSTYFVTDKKYQDSSCHDEESFKVDKCD